MEKITLQNNMDDGYGAVYCVGKLTFSLNDIHEWYGIWGGIDKNGERLIRDTDACFPEGVTTPFKTVEAFVTFLEEQLVLAEKYDNYDFLCGISPELEKTDIFDHFIATSNPNGFGNNVDSLVVTYEGEIIFEF